MAALDTLTEQIDHRIKVTSSRLGTSRADVRDVLETLRGELRAGFEMWKLQTESDYLRRHTEILFRLCLGLLALKILLGIFYPSVF